jgi:hypothetical protein
MMISVGAAFLSTVALVCDVVVADKVGKEGGAAWGEAVGGGYKSSLWLPTMSMALLSHIQTFRDLLHSHRLR